MPQKPNCITATNCLHLAPLFFERGYIMYAILILFAILLIGYGGARLGYEFQIDGWKAEFEQCRQDIQKVNRFNSEDVYGQAVELNREIRKFQAYNSRWFIDIAIPDEVDNIKLIEIPPMEN